MGENDIDVEIALADRRDDSVGIPVRIRWVHAVVALRAFLHPALDLPPGMTDQQLVDLMDACAKARTRIRENAVRAGGSTTNVS